MTLSLCPVTTLLFAVQLTDYSPYQMLLTTLIPKHMYSYISENNFGASNQIIVPTGYTVLECCSKFIFNLIVKMLKK